MRQNGRLRFLLLSGGFSSAAVFIKGSALFSVLVVPIMLIYSFVVYESYGLKSFITKILIYALGISIPFMILSVYFWSNGALYDFYYAFFTANGAYVQMIPFSEGLINTYGFMRRVVASEFEILTLLALTSAVLSLDSTYQKISMTEKIGQSSISSLPYLFCHLSGSSPAGVCTPITTCKWRFHTLL